MINFDDALFQQLISSPLHVELSDSLVDDRFDYIDSEQVASKITSAIPITTQRKEKWASTMFLKWLEGRRMQQEFLGDKEVDCFSATDWNLAMKHFVFEVRKENNEKYCSTSLKDLFSMVQHYVQYTLKQTINFWTDNEMKEARRALDAAMKETSREGNLAGRNASQPISANQESDCFLSLLNRLTGLLAGMLYAHEEPC